MFRSVAHLAGRAVALSARGDNLPGGLARRGHVHEAGLRILRRSARRRRFGPHRLLAFAAVAVFPVVGCQWFSKTCRIMPVVIATNT